MSLIEQLKAIPKERLKKDEEIAQAYDYLRKVYD